MCESKDDDEMKFSSSSFVYRYPSAFSISVNTIGKYYNNERLLEKYSCSKHIFWKAQISSVRKLALV